MAVYVESRLPALLASVLVQEARRLALGYIWAGETWGSVAIVQTPAGSQGITVVFSRLGKSISTLAHGSSRVRQPGAPFWHLRGPNGMGLGWV